MFLQIYIVIALTGFFGTKGDTQEQSHPNMLLIVVDDLRPALGCYGDSMAISPNIDKLATTGTTYSRAYTQQALCGPSRTSFLTSRRPDTLKLIDVHHYWREHAGNFTTLPQYFKENGYDTISVGKIFHPDFAGKVSNFTDDAKYSWSEKPYHPSSHSHKQDPVCLGTDGKYHTNIYCPVDVEKQPEETLPDMQTTEYTVDWLRKRSMKKYRKPFFLAVGFHKPHIPLKFPQEFLELFPIDKMTLAPNRKRPKNLPLVAWNPWNDLRRRDDIHALNVSFPFGQITDYYAKYIRQGYYASISYIDFLFGLISSEVNTLFPNTVIAFISDHGWSLGEHQEWSKFSNFEVATRVPFILGKPFTSDFSYSSTNIQKSFEHYVETSKEEHNSPYIINMNHELVELLDLFPTLVDLAGLPSIPKCTSESKVLACTEGFSLVQKCNQKDKTSCHHRVAAVSQYPRPHQIPTQQPDSDQPSLQETHIMGYSLRFTRFRYTVWVQFNHTSFVPNWDNIYQRELYDHVLDDEENFNLIYPQLNIITDER